jgi:hypothetical protein
MIKAESEWSSRGLRQEMLKQQRVYDFGDLIGQEVTAPGMAEKRYGPSTC